MCTHTFRLAYLNFAVERSVDIKLEQLARIGRQHNLLFDVIVFTPNQTARVHDNYKVFRLPCWQAGPSWSSKIQWPFRLWYSGSVLDWTQYDAVILRYPKLPLAGRRLLRKLACPVFTEHHTNEVMEILGRGTIVRRMTARLERYLRKWFLPQVQGVIGVTSEIVDTVRLDAGDIPCAVISNGVSVNEIPHTGFQPFDGTTLRLIFVASQFVPWHGVDRLLKGVRQYEGNCCFDIVLLGEIPRGLRSLIVECNQGARISIRCPGALYGEAGNAYYADANLAIASLGLYRKGMKQACTLKAREYVARGIPFVYGYQDPDIPEKCDFALQVSNDNKPIDMVPVLAFAVRTAKDSCMSARMRQFAIEQLEWSGKLQSLHDFVRKTCLDIRNNI